MKIQTFMVYASESNARAVLDLDAIVNRFIKSRWIISVSGISFLPAPGGISPMLTRTVMYEEDEDENSPG